VFDLETIADAATYESPFTPPSGIQYVFVNGQSVISSGKTIGSLPGKVLRKQ